MSGHLQQVGAVLSCAQPPTASERMGCVSPGQDQRSLRSPGPGSPEPEASTAEAALPAQHREEGSPSPTCWQRSPCRGQEQRLPVARAGALVSHGLSSTFWPTVPPSTAAPGDLALGSALAAGAPAPATGVPRARAPTSALHTHPWEQVVAPEGVPARTWGTRSPAVLMSQVATVTRGATEQDGTLGSSRASVRPGEVRRWQRRDVAAAGLWACAEAHPPLPHLCPASPSESAEEHLEDTAQRCWNRDSPDAPC